jgi:acetoacetyl-CoA reductase/3-oxoacyl-[acyl-carrier protein] reductase
MEDMCKVALVTGSSRGIGAEMIRGFARLGYRVVINYLRSQRQAFDLKEEIESAFSLDSTLVVRADVANRSQVRQMFVQAYERFGSVDVLVNNAGINLDRPFLEMSDEDWDLVIGTILTGTFICSQEFAFRYKGNEGNIVNLGSVTAFRGRKNGVNYCSARAGVVNLTRCLALELAPRTRVNCVTPGFIGTNEVTERYQLDRQDNLEKILDNIPMRKLGIPQDVFQMVEFIVDHSHYVTGQTFFVDGGYYMH